METTSDTQETTVTYYKAVRLNGSDFRTDTVFWAVKPGEIVRHPTSTLPPDEWRSASDYLSTATGPTDCTEMVWPARLLEVEPVGGHPVGTPEPYSHPHTRAATAWRVVREVDPRLALGPQGEVLVEFLDALSDLTEDEIDAMAAALAAGRGAGRERKSALDAALDAARVASRVAAAWSTARSVAQIAALAILLADLVGHHGLTREHLDVLTGPARTIPRLAVIVDRALTSNEEIPS